MSVTSASTVEPSTTFTVGLELEAACLVFGKYTDEFYAKLVELLTNSTTGLSFEEGGSPDPNFANWIVKGDDSVVWRGDIGDAREESLELTTPVWQHDRPTRATELRSVLSCLKGQNNPGQSDRFEIQVNDTCALQVHVGVANRGSGNSIFDQRTTRNFAMIVTAAEPHINRMHPPRRSEMGSSSSYCRPPSLLWHGRHQNPERKLCRTLEVVECQNVDEIADLFNVFGEGASPAYRFRNLRTDNLGIYPPTVEFRQHEGTLNGDDCIAWTAFCAALVQKAHESSDQQIFDIIAKTADENFDLIDLFDAINLIPAAQNYYRTKLGLVHGAFANPPTSMEEEACLQQTAERLRASMGHR